MLSRLMHIFILPLLLLSGSIFADQLEDPAPIPVPHGMTLELVQVAIKGAIIEKGWVEETTDAKPNNITAAYYVRTHKISVDISYDSTQVVMSYVDSENMKFKEKKGKRTIHRNYMAWSVLLADKITANMAQGSNYKPSAVTDPSARRPVNLPPKEVLSNFAQFKVEKVTLEESFASNDGNVSTQKNLEHNLNLKLLPIIEPWNNANKIGRTLLIQPHIQAVRFIGTGVRIFAGGMAGHSWIYVRLLLKDEATGEVISDAEIYRIAGMGNTFTGSRKDYQMVEDMAGDIAQFIENNYTNPLGGGMLPPEKIKTEFGPKK